MEHDTVSPPNKKWTKQEIRELFEKGKTVAEIKKITGLPGKVVGGMKGYYRSPMYDGPPVDIKENGGAKKEEVVPEALATPRASSPPGPNGGALATTLAGQDVPGVDLSAGPGEAQALSVLLGKPYLIRVQNVYVSPDALKCYQVLVARGFKGSVGDFFELCVLKTFKEIYGLVPGMIRPEGLPS